MKRQRGIGIVIVMLIGGICLSAGLSPAQAQGVAHGHEKTLDSTPLGNGTLPNLRAFIHEVQNGRADQIVGLYAPGLTAVHIELQPQDAPFYVTDNPSGVSLFSASLANGTVGLLAHSHLAGVSFSRMDINQPAILIFGDGRLVHHYVNRIEAYQALEPGNPYSAFLSLADGSQWGNQDLFSHIYGSGSPLVLQTCLEQNGQPNWGRLFVIASPSQVPAAKTFVSAYAFSLD